MRDRKVWKKVMKARKQLKRLETKIAGTVWILKDAGFDLDEAYEEANGTNGKKDTDEMNEASPRDGAANVYIDEQPGLGYAVKIDQDVMTLDLGKRHVLKELIVALCSKESAIYGSPNGFVPMKSSEELRAILFARTGKIITEGGLRQHVCRLRDLLTDHGLHPGFVDSGRDGGYRFMLKAGGRVLERRNGGDYEIIIG